jgi:hypothetical protein
MAIASPTGADQSTSLKLPADMPRPVAPMMPILY